MPELIGHHHQREALARLRSRGILPSTLLFVGPAGIGKRQVARELARALLCETPGDTPLPCGHCKSCQLTNVGNHPDFIVVESSNRETWDTAEVRSLLSSLQLHPYLGGRRVLILNDAELMTEQAANALLKTLEEPFPGNYFLLVSSNPSKLPSPIISRCQRWNFDGLSADELSRVATVVLESNPEIREALLEAGVEQQESILRLSDGSIQNFIELTSQLPEVKTILEALEAMRTGDLPCALRLAGNFSKEREALSGKLRIVRMLARKQLYEVPDTSLRLRYAQLLSNVIEAERAIFERNLSASLVLNQVFLAFSNPQRLSGSNADASLLQNLIL